MPPKKRSVYGGCLPRLTPEALGDEQPPELMGKACARCQGPVCVFKTQQALVALMEGLGVLPVDVYSYIDVYFYAPTRQKRNRDRKLEVTIHGDKVRTDVPLAHFLVNVAALLQEVRNV